MTTNLTSSAVIPHSHHFSMNWFACTLLKPWGWYFPGHCRSEDLKLYGIITCTESYVFTAVGCPGSFLRTFFFFFFFNCSPALNVSQLSVCSSSFYLYIVTCIYDTPYTWLLPFNSVSIASLIWILSFWQRWLLRCKCDGIESQMDFQNV